MTKEEEKKAMTKTVEKVDETKTEQPVSLADAYKNSPELQAIYDFDGNTLVPKNTDQDSQAALNSVIEPLDQESKSYGDMIAQWQGERERYEAQMNQRIERKQEASKWGSIVEAASALTNLIGTTKGASFVPIEQKSQTWQAQADALMKERDTKMENFRSQMSTLRKMKQDIEMKKATVKSAYNTQKETTARQNARLASQAATAIAKSAVSANVQLTKNKDAAIRSIQSNATRILTAILSDNVQMGIAPSEASVQKWSDLAYQIALDQYKSTNPGDFSGDNDPMGDATKW